MSDSDLQFPIIVDSLHGVELSDEGVSIFPRERRITTEEIREVRTDSWTYLNKDGSSVTRILFSTFDYNLLLINRNQTREARAAQLMRHCGTTTSFLNRK